MTQNTSKAGQNPQDRSDGTWLGPTKQDPPSIPPAPPQGSGISRREMLSGALGTALAASGISEVKTIDASGEIVGVVLKSPVAVSQKAIENISKKWKQTWKGTPLENVQGVILESGMDIEVIRK